MNLSGSIECLELTIFLKKTVINFVWLGLKSLENSLEILSIMEQDLLDPAKAYYQLLFMKSCTYILIGMQIRVLKLFFQTQGSKRRIDRRSYYAM